MRRSFQVAAVGAFVVSGASAGAGCVSDALCGAGTRLEDGVCVVAGGGGSGATGGSGGGGAGVAGGGEGQGGSGTTSSTGQGGSGAGGAVVDPGYPDYPATIDHLTIAIRTGSGVNDATNTNTLSVCLTQTECFPLNVKDVNDFRSGEVDVYHFTGVGLPRAEVDRVELRSVNGADAWRPDCMEIQLDGEPVYCEDALDFLMGSGPNELQSFSDPKKLHTACSRCYPDFITHGPLVGAVTDKDARVMLRTDATRKVAVHLVDAESPSDAPIVKYVYPTPTDDYAATFVVDGLSPDRRYKAFFEVDGELSTREAEIHTAPAPGSKSAFRVGLGSCAKEADQSIFGAILEKKPDLFVFVGDNHYGNTPDLESLWWYYRWSLERPERAALVASTPTVAVWDDHDFVGNNTNGTSPGKEQALRAFSHYWANTSYGTAETPGVFSKYTHGDVDFFLLDDRYYRSPPDNPGGTMIGAGQTAWLKEQLLASKGTFKVLVSGSLFSQTGGESWLNYPPARADLFDFIRDQDVQGVVLVAGDIHKSLFRRIFRVADGGYDLPEIVSSPLANPGGACPTEADALPDAEQLFCLGQENSFVTVDFDTTAADPKLVARILDATGVVRSTFNVKRSDLQ